MSETTKKYLFEENHHFKLSNKSGGGATKVDTEAALNPVNCRYAFCKKNWKVSITGAKKCKNQLRREMTLSSDKKCAYSLYRVLDTYWLSNELDTGCDFEQQ